MTIKEMLKKVEAYNEVAEMLGTEKAVLRVIFDGFGLSEEVKDAKSFKSFVKETYIPEIASVVLKCEDYEFHKNHVFEVEGYFGDMIKSEVEFFIGIE